MPPNIRQRIYWDACDWLSYINGIPDRLPVLDAILADSAAEKGMITLFTSVLSQVEVAYGINEQINKTLEPNIESKIDELWADRDVIKIVDYHELIGLEARGLMRLAVTRGWQLKPIDAIHLATAKSVNAQEFQTYDKSLEKFSTDLGIIICEPHASSPRLPI